MSKPRRTLAALMGATILSAGPLAAQTDPCALVGGQLPAGCEQDNAGSAVAMPAGENTERDTGPVVAPEGFVISVNGETVTGDERAEDVVRRTDLALEKADVQIVFDGLGATPRLDVETVGAARGYAAGETVTLQSATNYPAFIARGEMRIIDRAARGGPRTVAIVPVEANGRVAVTLPEGGDLVAVHRVYDARGRYDETAALPLSTPDDRGLQDAVEEGNDSTVLRRIPVEGGAVTVRGRNVAKGARVTALGEAVTPDPSGGFILQRILPPGDYEVPVSIKGSGQNVDLVRDIAIPVADWFYIINADVTYGWRDSDLDGEETYERGRLAFYLDGTTKSGVRITASADTGEEDLEDLFRNLDEKDPRSTLLRVDPNDLYPTYGDDSTSYDSTPTSGKFYFRAEKDGNFFTWGDFQAQIGGNDYLRNERTLYGAQGYIATPQTTQSGEARASLTLYAAQPDMLPQRDVFRGTGGSVYFLRRQDISIASETITVQVRDDVTGRVLETRQLVFGRDYDINYIQGTITLSQPLSSNTGTGLIVGNPLGDAEVALIVQYEYTPTTGDVDGFAYGGRAEGWVTDQLRLGVTALSEDTGTADQTAVGADILFRYSEDTYAKLEYAQTEGPGFGSTISTDGGLIIDSVDTASGTGEAIKGQFRIGLGDLGLQAKGAVGGYFERRTEGFSTLDYQVTDATGDEELWGVFADVEASARVSFSFYYDDYSNAQDEHNRTGGASVEYRASDRLTWALGLEHVDTRDSDEDGSRTDAAVRLTYAASDAATYYAYVQSTLDRDGLDRNDRLGFGADLKLKNGWSVQGEISDGTSGPGGRIQVTQKKDDNSSTYFGYELDPGRELTGQTLDGTDQGRFVMGGTRQINSTLDVFGENTYDMFGSRRTLTSQYGLTYTPSDFLAYTGTLSVGTIRDARNGDFDRTALSFGVRYQDETLTASGRMEYRTERGTTSGTNRDSDTLLISGSARWKIDEEQRLVFSLDASKTDTDQSSVLDGELVDVVLGYAYRPIDNDKLNVLLRYRYLYDMYGQRVDGEDETGPLQRSHVFSVDASYDVSRNWTLGGKLGFRLSETASGEGEDFAQNDAWLAIINARYHLVHEWDILVEARALTLEQAGTTDVGMLGAVYKHVGNNVKIGVGYNFGTFSDDLTDLTYDDKGAFLNLVAKF